MKKFYKIYSDLESAILNNEYKPGELLPSETTIANQYEVSRETVRKAQRMLLDNGYIQKKQGFGAIVLDTNRFKIPSDLVSFNELQKEHGLRSEIVVLKNKREKIPKKIADKIGVMATSEVISIERKRIINGEAVILDKDYLLADIVSDIPLSIAGKSLFDYIENDLGLKIGYARKEFTVEPITEEDRILLDLKNDTHVVVIRSEIYLENTQFLQFHEARHRVDKFKFVDFARRRDF